MSNNNPHLGLSPKKKTVQSLQQHIHTNNRKSDSIIVKINQESNTRNTIYEDVEEYEEGSSTDITYASSVPIVIKNNTGRLRFFKTLQKSQQPLILDPLLESARNDSKNKVIIKSNMKNDDNITTDDSIPLNVLPILKRNQQIKSAVGSNSVENSIADLRNNNSFGDIKIGGTSTINRMTNRLSYNIEENIVIEDSDDDVSIDFVRRGIENNENATHSNDNKDTVTVSNVKYQATNNNSEVISGKSNMVTTIATETTEHTNKIQKNDNDTSSSSIVESPIHNLNLNLNVSPLPDRDNDNDDSSSTVPGTVKKENTDHETSNNNISMTNPNTNSIQRVRRSLTSSSILRKRRRASSQSNHNNNNNSNNQSNINDSPIKNFKNNNSLSMDYSENQSPGIVHTHKKLHSIPRLSPGLNINTRNDNNYDTNDNNSSNNISTNSNSNNNKILNNSPSDTSSILATGVRRAQTSSIAKNDNKNINNSPSSVNSSSPSSPSPRIKMLSPLRRRRHSLYNTNSRSISATNSNISPAKYTTELNNLQKSFIKELNNYEILFDEKNTDISKLLEKLHKNQTKIKGLNQCLDEVRFKYSTLSSEYKIICMTSNSNENLITTLKLEKLNKLKEVETLKVSMADKDMKIADKQKIITDLENKVAELNENAANLENDLNNEIEKVKTENINKIEDLISDNDKLNSEVSTLKTLQNEQVDKITELNNLIEKLESTNEKLEIEKKELQDKINFVKEEKEKTVTENGKNLKEKEESLNKLQADLKNLQDLYNILQDKCKNSETENLKLQDIIHNNDDNTTNNANDNSSEVVKLKEEISKLESSHLKELEDYLLQTENFQKDIKLKNEENERLKLENEKLLQQQTINSANAISKDDEEINKLKEQVENYKLEVNKLQEDSGKKLELLAEDLYIQYSSKHEQKVKLLKKNYQIRYQEQINKLELSNTALREEIELLKQQLNNERNEKQQLVKLWESEEKRGINK
ncbi:uncharacterized protein SCODWIG_02215 [Saccharomycodes ludwigii]|uniref:Autophagy-related protein 23 n=1 Tax=Saccharomycodes ludwigii TaxID=36035 RepID=A0A376B7J4_9ASCO|nr:hypothetical protein SCDLUD_002077 [Saccharomycodes ludwigii]KAH3902260.1 hypothetical protein SCDLUD_002077 [Saccharomycodes ludwigii]SSD60454.1 uncharacterized protein SCODWIG_02215 [Saccharomycodes ludwigii]